VVSVTEVLEELCSLVVESTKRATPRRKLRRFGKKNTERKKLPAQERRKHREAAAANPHSPIEQFRQKSKARGFA